MSKLSRFFNKGITAVKKHSPELLIATGIISAGVGVFFACKATLSVEDILDETKEQIETINANAPQELEDGTIVTKKYHNKKTDTDEEYTTKIAKRDKTIVTVKAIGKITKHYLPAALFLTLALCSTLGGFKIIKGRYVAVAGALAAKSAEFKNYRGYISEKYGKDADMQALLGMTENTEVVTNTDGSIEKKTTKNVNIPNNDGFVYVYSAATSQKFVANADINKGELISAERFAQRELEKRGHLFLNDIFDMIGMKRTSVGACYGWVIEKDKPTPVISFGIEYWEDEFGAATIIDAIGHEAIGRDADIWMMFNCDDLPIIDRI